jgi:hypothetical protein
MSKHNDNLISGEDAWERAAVVAAPFIGYLPKDKAPELIKRIAHSLLLESFQAYNRGLDSITLGGPNHKHEVKNFTSGAA